MSTQELTIKKPPPPSPKTLRGELESPAFAAAVAKALPKHCTADRFIRVACTTMLRTPKLAQCDRTSFFNALLTLSQLGLEPDGRRAHLIPFNNNKRGTVECQLIIDYKGLAELAMLSGQLSNLHADVVCENDEFEYNCGQVVKHVVNFRKLRGEVFAVYAVATFKDGSKKADAMNVEEVEAIRARSRAKDAGPWVTDWNEMAKKTVFRRLSKWLPISPEARDAIDREDSQTIEVASFTLEEHEERRPLFTKPAEIQGPPLAAIEDQLPGAEVEVQS